MKKFEVKLEQRAETRLYGLWDKTSDKTLAKDIPVLSSKYHQLTGMQSDTVLPFFVLSRNYDKHTGSSELLIGSLLKNENLSELVLPCDCYAVITVKPKFGMLWGLAVGEAKRYFYTKWLPQSDYDAQNLEYEYHTDKTVGKNPTVDIVLAITKRAK